MTERELNRILRSFLTQKEIDKLTYEEKVELASINDRTVNVMLTWPEYEDPEPEQDS